MIFVLINIIPRVQKAQYLISSDALLVHDRLRCDTVILNKILKFRFGLNLLRNALIEVMIQKLVVCRCFSVQK